MEEQVKELIDDFHEFCLELHKQRIPQMWDNWELLYIAKLIREK